MKRSQDLTEDLPIETVANAQHFRVRPSSLTRQRAESMTDRKRDLFFPWVGEYFPSIPGISCPQMVMQIREPWWEHSPAKAFQHQCSEFVWGPWITPVILESFPVSWFLAFHNSIRDQPWEAELYSYFNCFGLCFTVFIFAFISLRIPLSNHHIVYFDFL